MTWARKWGATLDDAEDLAQEVLLKVLRFHEQFRGESRLSSWAYRIARNEFLARARRTAVRARAEVRFDLTSPPATGDHEGPILAAVEARALVRRWLRAGVLSEEERWLFELVVVQGLSSAEAGARLGFKAGSIRARMSRSAARVRRELRAV